MAPLWVLAATVPRGSLRWTSLSVSRTLQVRSALLLTAAPTLADMLAQWMFSGALVSRLISSPDPSSLSSLMLFSSSFLQWWLQRISTFGLLALMALHTSHKLRAVHVSAIACIAVAAPLIVLFHLTPVNAALAMMLSAAVGVSYAFTSLWGHAAVCALATFLMMATLRSLLAPLGGAVLGCLGSISGGCDEATVHHVIVNNNINNNNNNNNNDSNDLNNDFSVNTYSTFFDPIAVLPSSMNISTLILLASILSGLALFSVRLPWKSMTQGLNGCMLCVQSLLLCLLETALYRSELYAGFAMIVTAALVMSVVYTLHRRGYVNSALACLAVAAQAGKLRLLLHANASVAVAVVFVYALTKPALFELQPRLSAGACAGE